MSGVWNWCYCSSTINHQVVMAASALSSDWFPFLPVSFQSLDKDRQIHYAYSPRIWSKGQQRGIILSLAVQILHYHHCNFGPSCVHFLWFPGHYHLTYFMYLRRRKYFWPLPVSHYDVYGFGFFVLYYKRLGDFVFCSLHNIEWWAVCTHLLFLD